MAPLIQGMIKDGDPMEVDPARLTARAEETPSEEALRQARQNLARCASTFLSAIVASVDAAPRCPPTTTGVDSLSLFFYGPRSSNSLLAWREGVDHPPLMEVNHRCNAGTPPAHRAFKKVVRILYEISEERFQGSGLRSLGGVIFLRLFCPAIVAPEAHNLASTPGAHHDSATEGLRAGWLTPEGCLPSVPPPVRRSLILVAKLLQSLVNETQFEKEDYMVPFNSWITENVVLINNAFMRWVVRLLRP